MQRARQMQRAIEQSAFTRSGLNGYAAGITTAELASGIETAAARYIDQTACRKVDPECAADGDATTLGEVRKRPRRRVRAIVDPTAGGGQRRTRCKRDHRRALRAGDGDRARRRAHGSGDGDAAAGERDAAAD